MHPEAKWLLPTVHKELEIYTVGRLLGRKLMKFKASSGSTTEKSQILGGNLCKFPPDPLQHFHSIKLGNKEAQEIDKPFFQPPNLPSVL